MKKVSLAMLLLAGSLTAFAQQRQFSWTVDAMDGSRTGCVAANASNVPEAMGVMRGCSYHAPDGKVFRGGATPKVAKILLAAQPAMAHVKAVIGYSPAEMKPEYPECALWNWSVDELMRATADSTGKKVDIGILNSGGIRVNMPKGDVLVDDLMSMFPFKNNPCYVALRGRDVRAILEQMAASAFQIVGGVQVVARAGKLVSVTVGGEPLDDDKLYGVATISFLLNGGDGYSVAHNAEEVIQCKGYLYDSMLSYVRQLTAQGRPIEYRTDGRIRILGEGETQ